jgi:hypothetical protein
MHAVGTLEPAIQLMDTLNTEPVFKSPRILLHKTSKNYKRMEIVSFTVLIKLTFCYREILSSKELNVHKLDFVHSFKYSEPVDCKFKEFQVGYFAFKHPHCHKPHNNLSNLYSAL